MRLRKEGTLHDIDHVLNVKLSSLCFLKGENESALTEGGAGQRMKLYLI